jgi:hypothetical protein
MQPQKYLSSKGFARVIGKSTSWLARNRAGNAGPVIPFIRLTRNIVLYELDFAQAFLRDITYSGTAPSPLATRVNDNARAASASAVNDNVASPPR